MGKAPAFQFYPGDWIQDTRILTPLTRGIWIDMLCFMWRSNERGKVEGTPEQLARMLSCKQEEIEISIKELSVTKIADVTNGNGCVTVINRRMFREEKTRTSTRCRVQKFRNAGVKRSCNESVTVPSSSSSSSSCTKVHNKREITSLFVESDSPLILAKNLFDKIQENNPQAKFPNLQVWAKQIDMMLQTDKRDPTDINAVIEWCQADDFWKTNILSAKKLREKFDQLYVKMTNQPRRHNGVNDWLTKKEEQYGPDQA